MKYIYYFNTVAGRIGICEENCLITDILFLDDETCLNENRIEGAIVKETELINDAQISCMTIFVEKERSSTYPFQLMEHPFKIWSGARFWKFHMVRQEAIKILQFK